MERVMNIPEETEEGDGGEAVVVLGSIDDSWAFGGVQLLLLEGG